MYVAWNKRLSRMIRGRIRASLLSRLAGPFSIGVIAQTRNGDLIADVDDYNVSRCLLWEGECDWAEIQLLAGLIDEHSRLVFAGAHIGAFVVPLVLGSGAREVLALEPSPHNFRRLQLNLRLNGIEQRVRALRVAVGDVPDTLRFSENPINRGNSRIDPNGAIEVSVTPLDFVSDGVVDLLVMDVEGYEVHALRGAQQTLAQTRNLYIEFAPEQLAEHRSTVAEFGAELRAFFTHAYQVDEDGMHPLPLDFPRWLAELPAKPGLLLNLLLRPEPLAPK